MSNPMNLSFAARLFSIALGLCLAACAKTGDGDDNQRPYSGIATDVVGKVARHTPMSTRCSNIARILVEAGISEKLATTMNEYQHAKMISSGAKYDWDNGRCPDAAVPGLGFGIGDSASSIIQGAHTASSMR